MIYAAVWFVFISLVTAIITAADKSFAKKGKRRVPEATLFSLAFLGGALAEYITMKHIRHKTLHKSFMLGLPAIILLQLGAVVYIITQYGIY